MESENRIFRQTRNEGRKAFREAKMAKGLRARLKDGETLVGTILTLASADVAEMMALVGFDYLWIDAEHAPMDFHSSEENPPGCRRPLSLPDPNPGE